MRTAAVLSSPLTAARAAPHGLRCPAAAAPAAKALRRAPRGITAVRAFQESDDKAAEAAAVAVTFSLQHKVHFAQEVVLVGDSPELGAWQLASAAAMTWGEGDVWSATVSLPAGADVAFKFAVTDPHRAASWESGPDRTLTVDAAPVRLLGAWGAPLEASAATEEEAAAMAAAVANQEAVQTVAAVTAAVVAEASAAAAAVAAEEEEKPQEEEAAASAPEPTMAETIQVAAALVTAVKKELDAAVKQQAKAVKMSRKGEAAVGAVIAAADAAAAPVATPVATPELVVAGPSSGNATKMQTKRAGRRSAPKPAATAPVGRAATEKPLGFGKPAPKPAPAPAAKSSSSNNSGSAPAGPASAGKAASKYSSEQMSFLRRSGKL